MAESGKGVIGILGGDFTLGLGQLGAQALGVVVLWTVIFGIAFTFFKIQNAVTKGGIRPTAEMEIEGMDIPEMGALAYPEFEFAIEHGGPGGRRASARRLDRGQPPHGEPSPHRSTDHPTHADRAGTARPCPPGPRSGSRLTHTAAWTPPRSSATS